MVQENELREVCVAAIQNDFTRSIPVQIMFTDGTAIGKQKVHSTALRPAISLVRPLGQILTSLKGHFSSKAR